MNPTTPDTAALGRLAAAWSSRGAVLWVAAGDAGTIHAAFPDASVSTTRTATNPYMLAPTLLARPSQYTTERFSMAFAPVPLT